MDRKRRQCLEKAESSLFHLGERQTQFEGYFDQFIALMVYFSIAVIILESDAGLNTRYSSIFVPANIFIYIVFTLEYIYKHFIGTKKFIKIFSLGSLLDIMALVPFILPLFTSMTPFNLHLLRLVWVIKIFRVPQYRRTSRILTKVFHREKETLSLTFSLCFALILVSSVLMWTIENEAQPEKFTSIISTMWWSVSTLTTVGYGDMYPITALGKVLAAFTAILGIGIFVIPTGVISAGFMTEYQLERREQREHSDHQDKEKNHG